ncbi:MAG: cytidylyltransferase domain-containing protein [Thermodesulfobacteriota bacterium]
MKQPSRNICIIPARGGSKRLPRKNILPLNGKPLISYTIDAAIQCGLFDKVCVSTEDEEIADIVLKYSAEVPYLRPHSLATDEVSVVEVCLDMLTYFEKKGIHFEALCCLYPTAVLRNHEDILNAYEIFKKGFFTVIAGTNYFFPPHQALVLNKDDTAHLFWKDIGEKQSQEIPEFLVDNGSTYWANAERFKLERTFYSSKTGFYRMPKIRSIDVDTEEDLQLLQRIIGSE